MSNSLFKKGIRPVSTFDMILGRRVEEMLSTIRDGKSGPAYIRISVSNEPFDQSKDRQGTVSAFYDYSEMVHESSFEDFTAGTA